MRQLDGLRALAVLLVCWHHWMPRRFHAGVNWGATGVDLFFVLSGFLITGILLRCRTHHEQGLQGVGATARRFYARRFLRIFPLYYAVLVPVTLFLALDRGVLVSLWTYTFNLYGGLRGVLSGTWVSHFWSLAVEEQFYLVWPWVVLLTPRRWLTPVIAGTLLLGPLSRWLLFQAGAPLDAMRMATTSCLDALAAGALCAWWIERDGLDAVRRSTFLRGCRWLGTPLFLWALWLQFRAQEQGTETVGALEILLVYSRWPLFAWLVVDAAHGLHGPLGRLLASRPLGWIGQVSYGVYVFHAFALVLDRLGLRALPPLLRFAVLGAFTLALAGLSWRFFESRVNALKERFPYRLAPPPAGDERLAA